MTQWWKPSSSHSMHGAKTKISAPKSRIQCTTILYNLIRNLTQSPSCNNILEICAHFSFNLRIFLITADKSLSSDYSIYPSFLKAYPGSISLPCSVRTTSNACLEYYTSLHQIFASDTLSHLLVHRCMVFISFHRKICCGFHIVDGVKWLPTKSQWCPGHGGVYSEQISWCGSLTYLYTHQLGGVYFCVFGNDMKYSASYWIYWVR